jgi:hypothetical protein
MQRKPARDTATAVSWCFGSASTCSTRAACVARCAAVKRGEGCETLLQRAPIVKTVAGPTGAASGTWLTHRSAWQ